MLPLVVYFQPHVVVHSSCLQADSDAVLAAYRAAPELGLHGPYSYADVESFRSPNGLCAAALVAGGGRLARPARAVAEFSVPQPRDVVGSFNVNRVYPAPPGVSSTPVNAGAVHPTLAPASCALISLSIAESIPRESYWDLPGGPPDASHAAMRALGPWAAFEIAEFGGPGAVLRSLPSVGDVAQARSAYAALDRVLRRGVLEGDAGSGRGLHPPSRAWLRVADDVAGQSLAVLSRAGHLHRIAAPHPPASPRVACIGLSNVPSLATIALSLDVERLAALETSLRPAFSVGSSAAPRVKGKKSGAARALRAGDALTDAIRSHVSIIMALSRLLDLPSDDVRAASLAAVLSPRDETGNLAAPVPLCAVLAAFAPPDAVVDAEMPASVLPPAAIEPTAPERPVRPLRESAGVLSCCHVYVLSSRSQTPGVGAPPTPISAIRAPVLVWSEVAAAAGLVTRGAASGLGLPWPTPGHEWWHAVSRG